MSRRCLVFDLDGTLIDSRLDLANAANLMRRAFNLPPLPMEQIISYLGNGLKKLCERALTGANIPVEEALPALMRAYRAGLTLNTVLYPGVFKTIRQLRTTGWKLAVLSNKNEDFCKSILYDLGIATQFDLIIGETEGFPLKPDPDGLRFVLETLRVEDPGSSWMIGDGATDLIAGHLAGMKTCYAAYGFGNVQSEPYDLKIGAFSELPEKLS